MRVDGETGASDNAGVVLLAEGGRAGVLTAEQWLVGRVGRE